MIANKKVYLASPWFKPETAERQSRICKYMKEKGFVVFDPKENVVTTDSAKDAQTNAFLGNLKAINEAEASGEFDPDTIDKYREWAQNLGEAYQHKYGYSADSFKSSED